MHYTFKGFPMKLRLLTLISLAYISLLASTVVAAEAQLEQLSLSAASALFRSNSRELLLSQRLLEGAEANSVVAAQKPNPVLSLGLASFNLNRNQANANPTGGSSLADKTLNSTIQLNQLFERGDKREIRIKAAEDAIQASNYDLKDMLRQQSMRLAYAYYDLTLAQESEKIQASNIALYEKTLQAAELRLKAGDIAFSDVARIRIDVLRAKNDWRQSIANHQKAQSNLAYLIGQEKNAASIVAIDQWTTSYTAVSDADTGNAESVDNKIKQRADILAAEARIQQAEENRRFANALKTRNIDVGVQYQHFPGQGPAAGDNTVGAFVSIPLFTNYQYQGEVARAEVDFNAAEDAKQQTRAVAIGEISRARADLSAAMEKVQRFDEQMLSEAQKAASAAEFAYQQGAKGVTDLLDARRVLRALQLDAATAHADYAKAFAVWQAVTTTEENP
jgi:cobalt-zinc-cadmium efflux system outer membrane protein